MQVLEQEGDNEWEQDLGSSAQPDAFSSHEYGNRFCPWSGSWSMVGRRCGRRIGLYADDNEHRLQSLHDKPRQYIGYMKHIQKDMVSRTRLALSHTIASGRLAIMRCGGHINIIDAESGSGDSQLHHS